MKRLCAFLLLVVTGYGHADQIRSAQSHQHTMDTIAEQAQQDQATVSIAVLVYNDVVLQDIAGPIEVFSKAKKLTGGQYQFFTVGLNEGPVAAEQHTLQFTPDYSLATMPEADYLIIPGASMPVIDKLMQSQQLADFLANWLRQTDNKIVSVCTGAYLLANTGALNGKKATTHFFVADDFAARFPEVELVRHVRFVEDQPFISSSGVTSGIDAALYIIGKESNPTLRDMIARALQYNHRQYEDWPVAAKDMHFQRH